MKIRLLFIISLISLLVLPTVLVHADTTNLNYGDGSYGNCDYGNCTITLASSGTVNINVTPTGSGSCTIQNDNATVTTDNTSGYTLTMSSSTTSTNLASGGNTITASSGTVSTPVTLASNKWGYRVDSLGGFGAGPTAAQSNVSTPSLTFAGVVASTSTPDTLLNATSPAGSGFTTKVWYGLCATTTLPSGTYTGQVTYTAITNN